MHRRPNKRGNRRGVNSAGGVSLASVLAPAIIEYWDAALGWTLSGGNVDTWTGQILATVLSAPGASQRPGYTAVNAGFNNNPTIDCYTTDTRYLRHAATTLLPAGVRPYVFIVTQKRTVAATTTVDFLTAASANVRRLVTDGTTSFRFTTAGNVTIRDRVPLDDDIHVHEFWTDASTGTHYSVDGVTLTNASETAATADAATQIRLGVGADESVAFMAIGIAAPSANVRSAALASARQRFAIP